MSKKLTISILSILLIGWIIGTSYYFVCKMRNNSEKNTVVTENISSPENVSDTTTNGIQVAEVPSFSISDGDNFKSESNAKISFQKGKVDFEVPEELASNFAVLNEYLANNPEKQLTITGLFSKNENGTDKLGMMRAEKMGQYLLDNFGINQNQVIYFEKEIISSQKKNFGGVEFGFNSISNANEQEQRSTDLGQTKMESDEYEKSISIDPSAYEKALRMVSGTKSIYYPPSGFDIEPNITGDLKKYFKSLKIFFDENSNEKVRITGYSDNSDDSYANSIISRGYAEKMKYYLIKNYGIKEKNIKTSGRGSSKLQNQNSSEIAKAQNRRVTFKLLK